MDVANILQQINEKLSIIHINLEQQKVKQEQLAKQNDELKIMILKVQYGADYHFYIKKCHD
jgi:hypothetical protein